MKPSNDYHLPNTQKYFEPLSEWIGQTRDHINTSPEAFEENSVSNRKRQAETGFLVSVKPIPGGVLESECWSAPRGSEHFAPRLGSLQERIVSVLILNSTLRDYFNRLYFVIFKWICLKNRASTFFLLVLQLWQWIVLCTILHMLTAGRFPLSKKEIRFLSS